MKHKVDIERMEAALMQVKRDTDTVRPTDAWQAGLMQQVRRQASRQDDTLIEFPASRFAWTAAVAASLAICFGIWTLDYDHILFDSLSIDVQGNAAKMARLM